jgi:hypothetical protein
VRYVLVLSIRKPVRAGLTSKVLSSLLSLLTS